MTSFSLSTLVRGGTNEVRGVMRVGGMCDGGMGHEILHINYNLISFCSPRSFGHHPLLHKVKMPIYVKEYFV